MVRSNIASSARLLVAACTLAGCSADSLVATPSIDARPGLQSPQLAVSSRTPLLFTTLDNAVAVMAPTYGAGAGAQISAAPANNSFTPGRHGNALLADADGEAVRYPQVVNGVQNIELEQGTMSFWYRPNYDHDDDIKYTIAGTGLWRSTRPVGSLHFGKHNRSNGNALFLIFYDANSVRWEHQVLTSDYSWKAGTWQHVVITWDFNAAAGERNLHLYVNDRELPLTHQVSRGPQPVPAEKSSEQIYIGSRGFGHIGANGLYDDFRIFDAVKAPN